MPAITDEKKITDMAFNVAIMGSFAIPTAGPVIAAVLATGQFFFDLFSPGAQADSRNVPATHADLDKAVDDIEKAGVDTAWWSRIDGVKADVLGDHDQFSKMWNKLALIQATNLVVDDDIAKTQQTFVVGKGDADFQGDAATYFNLGDDNGTGPSLIKNGFNLTLRTDSDKQLDPVKVLHHQTRTTSFYCLIASLAISYYKAAVVWRWGHDEVLLYHEYLAYLAQKKVWDSHDIAWQADHENQTPHNPVKDGDPLPVAPDWNLWVHSASSPVSDFLDAVDKALEYSLGDGTDDNPGLYAKMSDNWNKGRSQKVAERVAKLSLQSKGSQYGTRYFYVDSEFGDVSTPTDSQAVAQLHLDTKRGALIAYEWHRWTQDYGLDGVDGDDLKAFGQMIEIWKRARQSVDFSVYTTVQGDTLASIAALAVIDSRPTPVIKGYGNADLAPIIFGANREQLDSLDGVLPSGKVLRIPNLRTYTVGANEALITIAAKPNIYFHGDSYMAIFNANRDILKDPNVIGSGQVLRIPDLVYSPDSIYTVLKGDTLLSIAREFYGHGDFYTKIFDANRDVLKDANSVAAGQTLTIPGLDPVVGSVEWCEARDSYQIYSVWDVTHKPYKPRFNTLRDMAVEMFGNPDLALKIFDLNAKMWQNLYDPIAFPDLTGTDGQMNLPELAYRALSNESLEDIAHKVYGATLPSNCTKVIALKNGLTAGTALTGGQVLILTCRQDVELQSNLHFNN